MSEFKPSTRPSGVQANDAAGEPEHPDLAIPQLRSMPGRRAGMSVEMSGGQATVVREADSLFGSPADNGPASPSWSRDPLKYMTEGTDSPIMSRDAKRSDLVDLGGLIGVTTIGAAVRNGWLVENEHGGYERGGEAKAPATPRAPAAQQQDAVGEEPAVAQQEQPEPQREAEPERSYLSHADEAMYREAEQLVGSQTFEAIKNIMVDPDIADMPEGLLNSVAQSLGTDLDGARQAIGQVATPMVQQATAKVEGMLGQGQAEAAFEWANKDPKGKELLRAAMRSQVQDRNLSGYQDVVAGYLAYLSDTNPQAVVNGIIAAGGKASIQSGRVIVHLGGR
jgi:hypothetical protein